VPILNAGDVAPEQASFLFDISLAHFLLFAKFAKPVAHDHAGIIPSRPREGKNETGLKSSGP
jgi:hypothetical protein